MAKDSYIHLGKKIEPMSESPIKSPSKEYFPSCHISGVEGMEVEDGDEVVLRGRVTSCTESSRNGKKDYSCEVEVTGLKVTAPKDSGDGLDSALSKIEKKKADGAEEVDETDTAEEEDAEGE